MQTWSLHKQGHWYTRCVPCEYQRQKRKRLAKQSESLRSLLTASLTAETLLNRLDGLLKAFGGPAAIARNLSPGEQAQLIAIIATHQEQQQQKAREAQERHDQAAADLDSPGMREQLYQLALRLASEDPHRVLSHLAASNPEAFAAWLRQDTPEATSIRQSISGNFPD